MSTENAYPDCVRYYEKNNSTLFAVTDESGDLVAVHEVFLDKNSNEIGRKTTGSPELGYVRFPGKGPAKIYEGEPEDGMKIWSETNREIWVDVSKVEDTIHR